MSDRVLAVLPARYASERFPGKPLALIDGVPMIVRVMRNVRDASSVDRVVVATDDERIMRAVTAAGGDAVMTAPELASGSDRVWAVAQREAYDVVVNVQGDEPLLPGSVVDAIVGQLRTEPSFDVSTPVVATTPSAASSPDVVTVARDEHAAAQYFSRTVVPHGAATVWRHVGVYAYRRAALERFVQAPPSHLERIEKLEQLRALSLGLRIGTVEIDVANHAVDRPADVSVVEQILAGRTHGTEVRLVVLDVDGVLTDGRIRYLGDHDQLLDFDVKDGHGVVSLLRAGFEVALLTARDSPALRRRAAELGIRHLRAGVTDKVAELDDLLSTLGLEWHAVCYVGDDDPDVPVMQRVGLSAAPADASSAAVAHASIVLARPGGRGAVRELADLLLAADAASPLIGRQP